MSSTYADRFTGHGAWGLALGSCHVVCRDRVRRLMRLMGIESLYPKPRQSVKDREHRIYQYLLRELVIEHVDQVLAAGVTYIRLRRGFAYLVAIMDWKSLSVLARKFSLTLEADFCLMALNRTLTRSIPQIFNTDHGC